MFICKRCSKTIRRVEDVRNCSICAPQAANIPDDATDKDYLTPAILGYMIGSASHSDHYDSSPVDDTPAFSGGGGDYGGAGASASWDSSSSSSSSSYDSGSSSSSDSSSSSSSSD